MVSFFTLKFLTMQDLKSFWKIPHNVGFIQVKIQHCGEFSSDLNQIIIGINVKDIKGVIRSFKDFKNPTLWGISEKQSHFSFQNSSQCRILKVFEKFLTMLDSFWKKFNLFDTTSIFFIQLVEAVYFRIPHNAGFEMFLKNSSQC